MKPAFLPGCHKKGVCSQLLIVSLSHSEISRDMSLSSVVSWRPSIPNTHQNGALSSADGILGLLFPEAANTCFSPKPVFKPCIQVYHHNTPTSQYTFMYLLLFSLLQLDI